jgi:hypothetical protein
MSQAALISIYMDYRINHIDKDVLMKRYNVSDVSLFKQYVNVGKSLYEVSNG